MRDMTDVLLVAHHERAEAAALVRSIVDWLGDHGHEGWLTPTDAAALDLSELGAERAPAAAGLVVSLGGDGTVLRAIQLLAGAPVPIIGVNIGLLGYLTEVEPPMLTASLERWDAGPSAGEWHVEERMMIDVDVRHGAGAADRADRTRWMALNEVVIEKREPGHTVRLQVSIDGAAFTTYAADGLIIATPTGSTAYSLSARGPVVSPQHRALLLTPVSPHMLFDRSLVLDPNEIVEVQVIGIRPATMSVDGQFGTGVNEGATITVRPSTSVARFVRFGRRRFHQILKAKFGLADR